MSAPVYEITGQLAPHLAENFHSENGEILVENEDEDGYLVAEPKPDTNAGGDA